MQLRSHQQTALDAMLTASHGAVLVPTGGGKTLIAIMDLVRRLSASQRGLTAVVVYPRLLLVNQLCEEYMQVIDNSNVHIMHVTLVILITSAPPNPRRLLSSTILLVLLVSLALSSPPITRCTKLLMLVLTLM